MANHRIKTAGYSFDKQQARRDTRRLEAEARQEAYDKLSVSERLVLIASRPGDSKRELRRLEKLK